MFKVIFQKERGVEFTISFESHQSKNTSDGLKLCC